MDPVTIVLGIVALAFAVLALTQRMRVSDLESKVKELEAKLADRLPAPAPDPEPALEPEPEEADESDPEEEPEEEADEEPEEEAEEEPEEEAEEEEIDEIEEIEAVDEIEPPPPAADPVDPTLRLAALEQVQQAFETCRYLDFDAIVKKPSTYRVTVPVTAASGPALRYLEDGMFPCLEEVRIEGTSAILHIDTSKGPP